MLGVMSAIGAAALPAPDRLARGARPGCTTQPLTDQRYAVRLSTGQTGGGARQSPIGCSCHDPSGPEMPRSACGERVVPRPRVGVRFGSHRGSLPPSGVCLGPVSSPPTRRHSSHTRLAHPAGRGAQPVENAVESRGAQHRARPVERTVPALSRGPHDTTMGEGEQPRGAARPGPTDAWRAVLDNVQPNQRAWLSACDPVTVHDDRDHRGTRRVHPDPGRGPAGGRARGCAQRGLRPRDPARHHRQPGPGVTEPTAGDRRTHASGRRPRLECPHRSTHRLIDMTTCRQLLAWPRCCSSPARASTSPDRCCIRIYPPPATSSPGPCGPARWRPASTRSTPSRPSSSALPTGSRTPPRSRWPRRRARPTTRSSSTASPAWARPTCSTRSATTSAASTPAPRCATCRARSSPTSSSTPSATTSRTASSGATATSTCS